MLFVSHLHTERLAPGTIKTYIAAIRYEQISRGLGNPKTYEMPRLEYVIRGFKKLSSGAQRRRLPITPEILRKLRKIWDKSPKKRVVGGILSLFFRLPSIRGSSGPFDKAVRPSLPSMLQRCEGG